MTAEEFKASAVTMIAETIREAQAGGRTAIVGLSGGSTPKPVYAALKDVHGIDWKRVTFFLIDERYVPVDHADSNVRMIKATLLTGSVVDAALETPPVALPLADCIAGYETQIAALSHIDLVILGMGDDGHTASLFPPVGPEAYGPAHVIHTTTDVFAVHDRISVTFPVLQFAKKRLFLITGEVKERLLQKMRHENEDVSLYPAQSVFDERTMWIVGP